MLAPDGNEGRLALGECREEGREREHDSQENLRDDVQAQQADQRLVGRSDGLGQGGRDRPAGEHLHEVVVRRVQSQGQTLQTADLRARVGIAAALLVAGVDARGGEGAGDGVGDSDVERSQRGDLAGLRHRRGRAGGADVGDARAEAVDGPAQQRVGLRQPGRDGDGGEEQRAEGGGGEALGVDAGVLVVGLAWDLESVACRLGMGLLSVYSRFHFSSFLAMLIVRRMGVDLVCTRRWLV